MNKKILEELLTPDQLASFRGLTTPRKIQDYLDSIDYSPEYTNRCAARVMTDHRAHCLDGGLFAAAALRRIGFSPRVVDIFPEPGTDDDHILAVYQLNGRLGAVAKSNFVGLRFREAVYRDLRELIMSYFEQSYNVDGMKTLRTYTRLLNLQDYDRIDWETSDAGVDVIEKALLKRQRIPLISTAMAGSLSPMDELNYKAGLMVANWDGLYKPH